MISGWQCARYGLAVRATPRYCATAVPSGIENGSRSHLMRILACFTSQFLNLGAAHSHFVFRVDKQAVLGEKPGGTTHRTSRWVDDHDSIHDNH